MDLPAIELPKIDLPFDIPVLIHPVVDHFAIALPVIILLIEFYNLFARKKSVGGFSFILIVLTVLVLIGAYFTGLVDGKESFDLLSPEGQEELKEHKLLGTYLMLASGVLLFFKLLAMTGNAFFRLLFFLALIGFIFMTYIQGKDGGELVYEHGANVERVKTLDDALFDANDALEDLKSKQEKAAAEPSEAIKAEPESPKEPAKEDTPVSVPTPNPISETVVEPQKEAPTEVLPTPKEPETVSPVDTLLESVTPKENSKVDTLLDNAKEEIKEVSQNALSSVKTAAQE